MRRWFWACLCLSAALASTLIAAVPAVAQGPSGGRRFSLIQTRVEYVGATINADGANEGPSINGEAFVADSAGGGIFHCRARFFLRRDGGSGRKLDKRIWTGSEGRCQPMAFEPSDPSPQDDVSFSSVPVQPDRETNGTFFRLNQTAGTIALCTLEDETLMRCSAEAPLR